MSEQKSNFLGIPVEGEINFYTDRSVIQKPIEELQPILQAVLDDPFIVRFGWHQYTPYFNDGDPCVFSVYGFWVLTELDIERFENPNLVPASVRPYYDSDLTSIGAPYESDSFDVSYGTHPSLGSVESEYARSEKDNRRILISEEYVGNYEESYLKVKTLSNAIEGGHFENVLHEAFGDPSFVVVNKDSIIVETYEHD